MDNDKRELKVGDWVEVDNARDNNYSASCVGRKGIIYDIALRNLWKYKVHFPNYTDSFHDYNLKYLGLSIGSKVVYNNEKYTITDHSGNDYVLSNDLKVSPESLIPYEEEEIVIVKIKPKMPRKFVRNALYEYNGNIYKCVQIVRSVKDVPICGLVMKLIEGRSQSMFFLSREDCRHLHIKYEDGLELMDSNLKIKRI